MLKTTFLCKNAFLGVINEQFSKHAWNKCQNLKQGAQKRSKIKDDTQPRHASEASELMMVMTCATVFEQHYRWLSM